jgi:uncharacterized membrane protein YdjX (TVP38/TMEM64 family)
MARLIAIAVVVALALLAMYFLADALGLTALMADPDLLGGARIWSVTLSVALLAADLVLPVPSSVLMTFNGAALGLVYGALASLMGVTGSAVLGYWLGSRGSALLQRAIGHREMDRAQRFFVRWGSFAVLLSRPIPIVAETTAVLAGSSRMGWGPFLASVVAGSVPVCAGYAWAGASVSRSFNSLLVFVAALLLAALLLLWRYWRRPRQQG